MKLFNKFHLKSIHILTDIKQHKHLIIIYFYIQKNKMFTLEQNFILLPLNNHKIWNRL